MTDYTAKIAPFINQEFYVTSEFGEVRNSGSIHKGLDIATPSALGGANLYSMCNGTVVYKTFDADGFGYYIIMKDNETGMRFSLWTYERSKPKKYRRYCTSRRICRH